VRISRQDLAPFFSGPELFHSSETSRSGTRWAHHNPTTTVWRSLAFGGGLRMSVISKNRLDSAYGALWRLTEDFGTDLKIMVPPVLISGSRHLLKRAFCR
jgi:hypothetical protein